MVSTPLFIIFIPVKGLKTGLAMRYVTHTLIYSNRVKTLMAHSEIFRNEVERLIHIHSFGNLGTYSKPLRGDRKVVTGRYPIEGGIRHLIKKEVEYIWIIDNRRINKKYIVFGDEIDLFSIARGRAFLKRYNGGQQQRREGNKNILK